MPCSPHYTTSATTYPSIHYSVLQSIKHAPKCTFKSDTKQCILVHFECISVHWWGVGLEVVWSKSHDRLKTIRKIVVVNQIWPQLSNKVILNWHNVVHLVHFDCNIVHHIMLVEGWDWGSVANKSWSSQYYKKVTLEIIFGQTNYSKWHETGKFFVLRKPTHI